MNKKILIPIIVIFVLGIGIFAWQYFVRPAPQEVEEEIKDETTDWKLFSSVEYNFEVKYPPTWSVREEDLEAVGNFRPKHGIWFESPPLNRRGPIITVVINITENPDRLLLKDWIREHEEERRPFRTIQYKEEIVVAGINAVQVIRSGRVIPGRFTNVYLAYGDLIYSFTLGFPIEDEELSPKAVNIFSQMLSIFRFLEE